MRGTRAAGSRKRQSVRAAASRDAMPRVACRFKVAADGDVAEAVAVPSAAVLLTPARSARTAKTPTKVARLNNFSDPNCLTLPAKSTPYGVSRSGSRSGPTLTSRLRPGRLPLARSLVAAAGPRSGYTSRARGQNDARIAVVMPQVPDGVPGSMAHHTSCNPDGPAATTGTIPCECADKRLPVLPVPQPLASLRSHPLIVVRRVQGRQRAFGLGMRIFKEHSDLHYPHFFLYPPIAGGSFRLARSPSKKGAELAGSVGSAFQKPAPCGRDEAERQDHGQAPRDGHLLSERRRMGLDLFVVRTTRSREAVLEQGHRAPCRAYRTRESGQ